MKLPRLVQMDSVNSRESHRDAFAFVLLEHKDQATTWILFARSLFTSSLEN